MDDSGLEVSYGKGFQGVEQREGISLHSDGVCKGRGGALGCVRLSWMLSDGLMMDDESARMTSSELNHQTPPALFCRRQGTCPKGRK